MARKKLGCFLRNGTVYWFRHQQVVARFRTAELLNGDTHDPGSDEHPALSLCLHERQIAKGTRSGSRALEQGDNCEVRSALCSLYLRKSHKSYKLFEEGKGQEDERDDTVRNEENTRQAV